MIKNARNPKYPYCTLFSFTGELVGFDVIVGTSEGAKVGELSTTVSCVEEDETANRERKKLNTWRILKMKMEKAKQ